MEDIARFAGPVGGSSRLAAYRAGLNGKSAAEIGMAAALARNSGARTSTPLAARTAPTVTTTKAKAATTATGDRVKIVAHAVANDPALAGKAGDAINFLADPAFAGVTGQGIVKLLKAGATASLPTAAATGPAPSPARSDALGGGDKPTQASARAWDSVISRMAVRF